jgi:hypothetical protein
MRIAGNSTGVTSFNGRTGAITSQAGDYTTTLVTEGTNLYFTNARVLSTALTGFVPSSGTITSLDTVLSAIEKLTGNIENLLPNALQSSYIFVGNASNMASPVPMTGDVSISNTGVTSIVSTSNSTITSLSALTSAPHIALSGDISGTTGATLLTATSNGTLATLSALTSAPNLALLGDVTGTAGANALTATSNSTLLSLSALTSAPELATVGTITSGNWNGATITVNHGGTGQASPLTTDGVVYAYSPSQMATTAAGTAGYVLTSNGNSPPTFQPTANVLTFIDSLVNNAGTVSLVNDNPAPGANQYYGTNPSGTLGYYSINTPAVNTLSTSNNTPVPIFNLTLDNTSVYYLEGRVTARYANGSSVEVFHYNVAVRAETSGSPSIVAPGQTVIFESNGSTLTVNWVISGSSVQLQVTGDASLTVNWKCFVNIYEQND